jgi:hypothetical protein
MYYKSNTNVIHIYFTLHNIDMSDVITIRIPKDMKALMKASNINWSEGIRNYIESRIKSLKLNKILKDITPVPKKKGGSDSTVLIREWRDMQ